MNEISLETLGKSIDVRAMTFEAFRCAIEALQEKPDADLKDNCVIILTNFGQIICKVDDQESVGEIIAKVVLQVRDSTLQKIPPETPVINKCKTLLLKNVVIIPFSNPQLRLNYDVIALFTNQIAGISIGKLPDETT